MTIDADESVNALVSVGLDEGREDGQWSAWLEYLFGEQVSASPTGRPLQPGALEVGSARYSEPVRRAVAPRAALAAAEEALSAAAK